MCWTKIEYFQKYVCLQHLWTFKMALFTCVWRWCCYSQNIRQSSLTMIEAKEWLYIEMLPWRFLSTGGNKETNQDPMMDDIPSTAILFCLTNFFQRLSLLQCLWTRKFLAFLNLGAIWSCFEPAFQDEFRDFPSCRSGIFALCITDLQNKLEIKVTVKSLKYIIPVEVWQFMLDHTNAQLKIIVSSHPCFIRQPDSRIAACLQLAKFIQTLFWISWWQVLIAVDLFRLSCNDIGTEIWYTWSFTNAEKNSRAVDSGDIAWRPVAPYLQIHELINLSCKMVRTVPVKWRRASSCYKKATWEAGDLLTGRKFSLFGKQSTPFECLLSEVVWTNYSMTCAANQTATFCSILHAVQFLFNFLSPSSECFVRLRVQKR